MTRIGISVSDFVPALGHLDDTVYRRVSYVEYGGHYPPANDPGMRRLFEEGIVSDMTRHLVSVELPDVLDIKDEARLIAENHAGTEPRYMVTDFGCGGWAGEGSETSGSAPRCSTARSPDASPATSRGCRRSWVPRSMPRTLSASPTAAI
ncbi:hypothetical protein ACWD6R_33640 [Streptomyces sp. NPDC005151]